jgi:hypothetical protein
MKRIYLSGLLVALVLAVSCASLPLKQKAVVSLAASETALEAAHDTERALCAPTADQTKAITHCDGAQAATLQLTDARHVAIAAVFSKAFDTEIKAAEALKVWRAGEPAPVGVAAYQKDLADLLALVAQTIPKSKDVVSKIQLALDQAAATALLLGVK